MAKKKVIIRQTYTDKSIESVILDGQDRVGTSLLDESWLQGSAFLYNLYGEQFALECSSAAQEVRSKYLPKNPRPEYDIYFASRQGYPFCAIGVAKTDGPWFKKCGKDSPSFMWGRNCHKFQIVQTCESSTLR